MDFKEKLLYHIWDEGHLTPDMHTVSGKSLTVIYGGQLNTNRGPDFVNAVLQIDGEFYNGSVEIHFKAQDWINHHHHEDPHYNNVILHLVYEHSSNNLMTLKENGEWVEILEIKKHLVEDIAKLLIAHKEDGEDLHVHYCDLLSLIAKERLIPILTHYGTSRFMSKIKRYNSALLNSNFDQVLYEGLMEAIGYDKNKFNLMSIAQALKWEQWKLWYSQGMTETQMISIILNTSGLLSRSAKSLKPEYIQELSNSFETQNFTARKISVDWQLFRVRPQNHPVYRIIALVNILYPALNPGIFQYFKTKLVKDSDVVDIKAIKTIFAKTNAISDYPGIGTAVTANILINIIFTIFYLFFDKFGDIARKEAILQQYLCHPGLIDNRILKFMKTHASLTISKTIDSKVVLQQGLIDIYYRFCQYHLCEACVLNYKNSLSE